jgi:adenosylhomocysteine nucleosidase
VCSPALSRNSSVHCGAIASGDEDIIDRARANELMMATGTWCIAWEGSGAAWVATFNRLHFVELRSSTDMADADAVTSCRDNRQRAMPNISQRLIR